MVNWWTDEDRMEFETRTEVMVKLFDGLLIGDIKVDGELSKTENVADAGGIATALQIAMALPDGNLEEFFENYARIWRGLTTLEFANSTDLTDVHAPGIYIAPANRVSIW